MSKPNIPKPPDPPVIAPDEKKIELNPQAKGSAKLKAGRQGTRGMQIALGGKTGGSSGLRIPQ